MQGIESGPHSDAAGRGVGWQIYRRFTEKVFFKKPEQILPDDGVMIEFLLIFFS